MNLTYYKGEHSITFGNKNTWTDWHLIPTSKPVISPPSVKIQTVDIPGMNGTLDLSTVLTGYQCYNNRTGSLEFILAPGYEYWENTKKEVMGYLHGRRMNVYLKDDPDHYYTGLLTVNDLKSDARLNSLTINYDLYPFRYDIVASDEAWLWDPFNFETGVIRNWSNVVVDGSLELMVNDCVNPTPVTIFPSSTMTIVHTYVTYEGASKTKTYSIGPTGTIDGPVLKPGYNTLRFTGNGTVSIHFRGGCL